MEEYYVGYFCIMQMINTGSFEHVNVVKSKLALCFSFWPNSFKYSNKN
jgi:hypothetical protein